MGYGVQSSSWVDGCLTEFRSILTIAKNRRRESPAGGFRRETPKGGTEMAPLRLGQVGCGRMGLRHLYGQVELRRQGFDTFELVALCDLHESAAGYVAQQAEEAFGRRPRTYSSFETMLERERLDAVDIVTDTQTHHGYALEAFDAGAHVATEKPMALTVRACQRVVEGARKAGRTLSVSENYRRDPMNRLTRALIQGGAIGEPQMMINMAVGGGGDRRVVTAWRSMKLRSGGPVLEQGVHTADLILYFMGDVLRVSAETHLWDKRLYTTQEPGLMSGTYAHRVPEDIDMRESFEPTARGHRIRGAPVRLRCDGTARLHQRSRGRVQGERRLWK